MMELRTLKDIDAKLATYIPAVKETTGKGITLERMYPLMAAVGNPEKKLKIIRIAGTSGKTSTAYYLSSLLVEAGKKVGLTVSPHVDSVAERVQINLKPITEKDFALALSEFITLVETANIKPTYFEIIVAFAYWYFVRQGVDYAVVETGMGGLHDGTNVAESADKLCVITDIGYDHMQILGTTLPEIAKQKAGIIHAGNQTLIFKQSKEILDVFKSWCSEMGANLEVLEPKPLNLEGYFAMPKYQQRNWLLAYEAYKYLQARDNITLLSNEQLSESMMVQVPGRMDKVIVSDKTIIMDGAHNFQKMQAFASSFKDSYPGQKAAVVLGLKEDKQFGEVLPLLLPITNTLIVTTFMASQDLPSVGVDPQVLSAEAKRVGFENVLVETNCTDAYKKLLDQSDSILIITGSFYLIGQLRNGHRELHNA